ncbi:MAG TPA: type II secretion system protein [Candidatus Paceibacterota bacterium]|nr:type II secretion system protein [Candidatus Paceibacterota bacterium]
MNKIKGFTLIELLVVIAIIGVLSSVVLASLNSARAKGAVASAKSNLANTRSQAELFYDANSNRYDGGTNATNVCDPAGLIGTIKGINAGVLAAAQANSSSATVSLDNAGPATSTLGICNSTANGWAAEVLLKDGNFFCVDSNGSAKTSASAMLTATTDVTC